MNPIFGAIAAGYTTKEIINFISNMFPGFSGKISQAISSGYSPDEVIKYLQKLNKSDFGKVAKKGNKNINYKLPEDDDKPKTSMEKANEIWYGGKEEFVPEQPKKSSVLPNLGKVALGATALGAGALASPMARTALSRALPSLSPLLQGAQAASQMPQAPTGQEEQISPDSLQSQQPPISNQVSPNIAQPQQVTQPEGIPTNIQNPLDKTREEADALWQRIQKGVTKHPDKDLNAFLKVASDLEKYQGLSRADFDNLFQKFIEKKNAGVPAAEIAKEMFSTYKQETPEAKLPHGVPEEKDIGFKAAFETLGGGSISNQLYEGVFDALKQGKDTYAGVKEPLLQAAKPAFDAGQIKSVEDLKKFADFYEKSKKHLNEEKPTIEKGSSVSSPQGIGEIKELRNGQALIDIDGKLHKVKEDELQASPLPEKELADLYDELIQGIESETGEDVSRMVQWAGYNPETNTLQFLPHTGKLYKYGDISKEDAALLTDILSTRKTSGENFIGAWKAGSKSPIGAALSKLIRKLQSERGGKGQEYEETHEPIYSAYEPAVQAAKKKKKKK